MGLPHEMGSMLEFTFKGTDVILILLPPLRDFRQGRFNPSLPCATSFAVVLTR